MQSSLQARHHFRSSPVWCSLALVVLMALAVTSQGDAQDNTDQPVAQNAPQKKKTRVPTRVCSAGRYKQDINHPGCMTTHIFTYACFGLCSNKVQAMTTAPYYKNTCRCCSVVDKVDVVVPLMCNHTGEWLDYTTTVESARSCTCSDCACDESSQDCNR